MGEIRELQQQIGEWKDREFERHPADAYLSQFVVYEELGELCRAVVKGAQNIRGTSEYWHEQKEGEVGDILISLLGYCHRVGIDAEAAVTAKWEIVGARKRGEHNPNE